MPLVETVKMLLSGPQVARNLPTLLLEVLALVLGPRHRVLLAEHLYPLGNLVPLSVVLLQKAAGVKTRIYTRLRVEC